MDDTTHKVLARQVEAWQDMVNTLQGTLATLRENAAAAGIIDYARRAVADREGGSLVALMARNENAARAVADGFRDLRRELAWAGRLERSHEAES